MASSVPELAPRLRAFTDQDLVMDTVAGCAAATKDNFNNAAARLLAGSCSSTPRTRAENVRVEEVVAAAAATPRDCGRAELDDTMGLAPVENVACVPVQKTD